MNLGDVVPKVAVVAVATTQVHGTYNVASLIVYVQFQSVVLIVLDGFSFKSRSMVLSIHENQFSQACWQFCALYIIT